MKCNSRYAVGILCIAVLAGCSSKPVTTPELKAVQKLYRQKAADPKLGENAPLALFQAGKIYDLSKHAQSEKEAEHLAYLLQRELEVVDESAKEAVLKKTLTSLKEKQQKALLSAKEAELLLLKKKMEQTESKLKEMEELNAKQTSRGLVLTLGDVLFETGKATLLPGAERAIDKLAQFLEENPEREVLIEGHTDNVGSATYNLDLSLRRAQAVKEALVAKGIDPERIHARGYGERYPVASNSDAAGRQRNRRVEIVILKEGADPEAMAR